MTVEDISDVMNNIPVVGSKDGESTMNDLNKTEVWKKKNTVTFLVM